MGIRPQTLYRLADSPVDLAAFLLDHVDGTGQPGLVQEVPDGLYQAPRSWAEHAYPENLIHHNRLDRGGHFAAWEQPQIFCDELRNALRTLR